MDQLHTWEMDLDYALAQIPAEERDQTPTGSEYLPSDSNRVEAAPGRKHESSLIRSPPLPTQHHMTAGFCTQRCLLGLRDNHCPNVELHRQGQPEGGNRHLIRTA
ncbi:hypothetical protein V8E54_010238 [Elaphomyces granulatus]